MTGKHPSEEATSQKGAPGAAAGNPPLEPNEDHVKPQQRVTVERQGLGEPAVDLKGEAPGEVEGSAGGDDLEDIISEPAAEVSTPGVKDSESGSPHEHRRPATPTTKPMQRKPSGGNQGDAKDSLREKEPKPSTSTVSKKRPNLKTTTRQSPALRRSQGKHPQRCVHPVHLLPPGHQVIPLQVLPHRWLLAVTHPQKTMTEYLESLASNQITRSQQTTLRGAGREG